MKQVMQLSEKEMMADGLASQKQISAGYNLHAGECNSKQLRTAFVNILSEEQELGAQIFEEMSARGWYQTKDAAQSDVAQVKQKFAKEIP